MKGDEVRGRFDEFKVLVVRRVEESFPLSVGVIGLAVTATMMALGDSGKGFCYCAFG